MASLVVKVIYTLIDYPGGQMCGARIGMIGRISHVVPKCVVPCGAQMCGAKCVVPNVWCQMCGAKCVVPNVWCQMCGANMCGAREFPEISRDLGVSHETLMTSQVT